MRASDADRDRVALVLREAAAEGRLDMDELDERLSAVYAAKTYAELEPITRDLPVPTGGAPIAHPAGSLDRAFGPYVDGAPSWSGGVGIMSGFERVGVWNVPRTFTGFAFWGGGKIDLRDARFADEEVHIRLFAVMGGIDVIVPDDMSVHVNGLGIMGGFDHKASGPGVPGSPRVVVSGFTFWGGVNVRRKERREERRRRKELKKQEKEQGELDA
ncbi:DUF1707 and DUF2154 domain-containing protein [Actinomadura barringtoniae]|uniref:DUF1707 and DUF2154 domain-containing protein n=2 Tax=Actinomadura barringtoniae TaxID=1427535 RepID=A0A939PS21_9ACTN|nr:DUF1707 and DUF2154 domain-containing protein [Actinomadura barringtoniae]